MKDEDHFVYDPTEFDARLVWAEYVEVTEEMVDHMSLDSLRLRKELLDAVCYVMKKHIYR